MQRGVKRRKRRSWRTTQAGEPRGTVAPQPSRPADLHHRIVYRLHVRNVGPGTWATYVTSTRERIGMTKAELARRLGVDRATIHRWESGANRPEDADLVHHFADLFGLDTDEALTAAGLRPTRKPAARPTKEPPLDPDLVIILRRLANPDVSAAEKATIRATLQYLAGLADRTPPPKRKRDAS